TAVRMDFFLDQCRKSLVRVESIAGCYTASKKQNDPPIRCAQCQSFQYQEPKIKKNDRRVLGEFYTHNKKFKIPSLLAIDLLSMQHFLPHPIASTIEHD